METIYTHIPLIFSSTSLIISIIGFFLMVERKDLQSLNHKVDKELNNQQLRFHGLITHIQTIQKENVDMIQNLKNEISPLKQKKKGNK